MNRLYNYIFGDNVANYVEVGFSEKEAEAMSWIAQQQPKGKVFGLVAGSFLALSWGHWHDRAAAYFRVTWSKRVSQFLILGGCICLGDYMFVSRRRGADHLIVNKLFLNNNLLLANLDSLVKNFNVLNRKFSSYEIDVFNDRSKAVRSNIDLKDRKWIYNPKLYTEEEFERRVKNATTAPWKDQHLVNTVKYENMHRESKELRMSPTVLSEIIDSKGDKLGISNETTPYWSPLK